MSSAFADELIATLPRLRRFAMSLAGEAAEAEDLVQATCERALRARDGFEPGTRMDAWTFRILRNLWLDRIRQRRREGLREPIGTAAEIEGEDGRDTVEASMRLKEVETAMTKLSPDMRQVLTLVCVEERSYGEAAELLNAPIGTIMSRLSRARRALAASLNLTDKPTGAAGGGA